MYKIVRKQELNASVTLMEIEAPTAIAIQMRTLFLILPNFLAP